MGNTIIQRVMKEANDMIKTGRTVRELASIYKVSKSTVHKDLHERLMEINPELYQSVAEILKYHTDVRHLRGGESTKKKYLKLNQSGVQSN